MSRKTKFFGLLILLAAALTTPVLAERADRDKPVNLESDRMNADDVKKTSVFEGRVVLTQGTMVIRADRLTVRQDSQGFQFGTAVGNPASFRQKREGFDEIIEGEAERIEYDGRADRVEFFNRARLRRDCGDDVVGNYISYDAKTEQFSVQSAKGTAAGKDERVRAVIMPKNPKAQSDKAPCAPLVSKPAAANPR
ncbi:MAG: lipopolysaccharide transport periplasmic protein LptA [Betaproteobacteria bacterium RIFCSPLOWO2_02_FULL_62_17]|nr:MAG: lipopolysaccharide transport periplasmic protein LptA [Betaproteobacteria bacterium RIFCSPLOWO2_02_FULL_62_17]